MARPAPTHGKCFPFERKRGGSSPYFEFGAQRRYPYAWHGGPGGVPQSRVAAESHGLGLDNADATPQFKGASMGVALVVLGVAIAVPVVATVMIARHIKKSDKARR